MNEIETGDLVGHKNYKYLDFRVVTRVTDEAIWLEFTSGLEIGPFPKKNYFIVKKGER